MRKSLSLGPMVLLVLAGTAIGTPAYQLSWDFEGNTNLPAGWSAPNGYEVRNTDAFLGGTPLASGNALYLHDVGAAGSGDEQYATFDLPAATNSWIFKSDVHWSANNLMSSSGLGWSYVNAPGGNAWMEGGSGGGRDLYWGDPWSVDWPGGQGKKIFSPAFRDLNNVIKYPGDGRITVKYNLPENPGKVTFVWETLSYTVKPGGDVPLWAGNVPNTGGVAWDVFRIQLGGSYMWSQSYFDNVMFESIPEPASLMLLGLGVVPLLRRRGCR